MGCGKDTTIHELAILVRRIVGADAAIEWDTAKPDGTPRKLLDVTKLSALGWHRTTEMEEGIRFAYADFLTWQ